METIEDIVREMRGYNTVMVSHWADRIEAAWRREREAHAPKLTANTEPWKAPLSNPFHGGGEA